MLRRTVLLVALALTVVITARPALAETSVVEPASQPYELTMGSSNRPEPFTVVASGFPAGSLVYIEQCDGKAPTSENWKPTLNCDLGTSPAAAIVDADGVATFDAGDANHAFHPFVGESPQQLFNCVAKTSDAPKNSLPTSTTCNVRVSSNNYASTDDQAFFTLAMPGASAGDDSSSSSSSSSSTTAIVVAVVLGLVVVGGGVFLFTRRRRASDVRN
jgi:hypothetical protein